ncbi:MAG: hypothetical protein MUF49_26175 [Oculatellaceae cyanobacterium Prado106]|nr:hypothetical protein [Oculatellaceae cyanobacterium Prado106]
MVIFLKGNDLTGLEAVGRSQRHSATTFSINMQYQHAASIHLLGDRSPPPNPNTLRMKQLSEIALTKI